MDTELRKKLLVPFIVLLAILGVNINTIVNGISEHNNVRIFTAAISSAIVLGVFVILFRNAKKGGGDKTD